MRKLAEEIQAMPHGRLKWIATQSGLTQQTVNKIVKHGRGSKVAAQKIAAAVQCPDRWPELLWITCDIVVAGRKRKAKRPPKRALTRKKAAPIAALKPLGTIQTLSSLPSDPAPAPDLDYRDLG